ncbi:hypothetical protein SporoP37_16435 (plasmid) [Sporosarcina sp. P37]|uniref:hypothetical protein n=1 Tax=Sporosarcina sp. P37 TaxID=1930546 RepID=UPI000A17BA17|nr:hypothetical protein [Sporosarcina sp. P37]ARK26425.1 hypothetical protein SporoP37_16435 [Sporosarcina sp. P37]
MYKGENQSIKYAKPSYEYIRNFGKGDLQVSGSTIDFLLSLSPHVDLDGKVNIPLEYICSKQDIQSRTFKHIITEALDEGLLVRKGEEYYSKFHIQTDGTDRKRTYIKPLEVFTSAQIRNCSKREKRLFYYFVTVTRLGQWQSINIENLYRNYIYKDDKSMDKKVCIDYFHSFREVSSALIKLVKLGLLEIELTPFNEERIPCSTKQKIYLKSDDEFIEEQ